MDLADRRVRMVKEQIAARGIGDARVLAAMREVPRERFVRAGGEAEAYDDRPLGIGRSQTISQPYVVALMAASLELRGPERVLEVGAGSGYGAAVLARLAREVFTIERHGDLALLAAERLRAIGCENVTVVEGDGTLGLPAHAPYDAIMVTAAAPSVPQALLEQLAVGGRLVIPVGRRPDTQRLLRLRRVSAEEVEEEDLGPVSFVPLIGAQGWRLAG